MQMGIRLILKCTFSFFDIHFWDIAPEWKFHKKYCIS